MKSRKKSCRSILVSHIPEGVIVDILSWLPVKSVLRFKCVCKSWKGITEWSVFIEMHKSRSKCHVVYEPIYKSSTGNYEFICYGVDGLVLEGNEKSGECRIRNPATKQVVQVESPIPRFGNPGLIFDSSTSAFKVINSHVKQGSPYVGIGMHTVRIEDYTNAACVSWSWKNLVDMNLYGLGALEIITMGDSDICYMITFCDELEKSDIIRFALDGKSSMNIKFPSGFLSAAAAAGIIEYELYQAFVFDKDKVVLGLIIKQELHAWVGTMENENHVWLEKKIIPLDFMKDYPEPGRITVERLSKSQLQVTIANHLLRYDIDSKKYTCLAEAPPGKQVLYQLTPCLVSLKGMHSEY